VTIIRDLKCHGLKPLSQGFMDAIGAALIGHRASMPKGGRAVKSA
jgi:hypothetical protein